MTTGRHITDTPRTHLFGTPNDSVAPEELLKRNTTTDTPRTDAATELYGERPFLVSAVPVEFAEGIERELAKSQEAYLKSIDRDDYLTRELAASKAEVERLKDSLNDCLGFLSLHGAVGATPDTARLLQKRILATLNQDNTNMEQNKVWKLGVGNNDAPLPLVMKSKGEGGPDFQWFRISEMQDAEELVDTLNRLEDRVAVLHAICLLFRDGTTGGHFENVNLALYQLKAFQTK